MYLVEDKKQERTDEFFYKDVTSFSTTSTSDIISTPVWATAQGCGGKSTLTIEEASIQSNKFVMVVPGDKLSMSMDGGSDAESTIQAMKQKLREKKM